MDNLVEPVGLTCMMSDKGAGKQYLLIRVTMVTMNDYHTFVLDHADVCLLEVTRTSVNCKEPATDPSHIKVKYEIPLCLHLFSPELLLHNRD